MAQVIAAMEAWVSEASTFRSTVDIAVSRVEDINTYIAAGRSAAARTLFDDVRSRIPMPFAGIVVPHMELHIEIAEANFDAAWRRTRGGRRPWRRTTSRCFVPI